LTFQDDDIVLTCDSNDKLFYRSIGIIAFLADVSDSIAHESLLKAIHCCDVLTSDVISLAISRHIEKATPMPLIIPTAILLSKGLKYKESREALEKEPQVRKIISSHLNNHP